MKLCRAIGAVVSLAALGIIARGQEEGKKPVNPAAILLFEERGSAVKEYGPKVTDILFAKLGGRADIYLVDREELKKTLGEQELGLSGAVKPQEATRVGQLTGAKLLITGSVLQVDKRLYLVARVIGSETGRVKAASVDGKSSDELGPLVEKLAEQVTGIIKEHGAELIAKASDKEARLAQLKKKLKDVKKPVVLVRISEQHVGQRPPDPAAQTEFLLFCKETGFEVIDAEAGVKGKADILITGEGFSESAGRRGNLVSVKARLEVKAIDRKTDKVLAADRQTTVTIDLTEQIAGKTALQEAAALIAERMLPQLVK